MCENNREKNRGRHTCLSLEQAADVAIYLEDRTAIFLLIARIDEVIQSESRSQDRIRLFYTKANLHSALYQMVHQDKNTVWDWEDDHLEQEVLSRRLAIRESSWSQLSRLRKAWNLVNLGNVMNSIGRPISAIDYHDTALNCYPGFGMARLNRSFAAIEISKYDYDPSHQQFIAWHANKEIKKCLRLRIEPHAREHARDQIDSLQKKYGRDWLDSKLPESPSVTFSSTEEHSYREWCLKNKLYLNTLNDFPGGWIASHDIVSSPSVTCKLGEIPWLFQVFNSIVQEFASARFNLWNAMQQNGVHFSDHDVHIAELGDGIVHSHQIEQLKLSFRAIWSIFDKVSMIARTHWDMNVPIRACSLKSIWYPNGEVARGISDDLIKKRNWLLRGLFWLSLDLYDPNKQFSTALDPEFKDIYELRNRLEHRFVQVSENTDSPWSPGDPNQVQSTIALNDLFRRIMVAAKLARESIILLSFSIHCDANMKSTETGFFAPHFTTSKTISEKTSRELDSQ